jgi:hypothetical protein
MIRQEAIEKIRSFISVGFKIKHPLLATDINISNNINDWLLDEDIETLTIENCRVIAESIEEID